MDKEILEFLNRLYDELRVLRKKMDEVVSAYEEKVGKDEKSALLESIIERSGLLQFDGLKIMMKLEQKTNSEQ